MELVVFVSNKKRHETFFIMQHIIREGSGKPV